MESTKQKKAKKPAGVTPVCTLRLSVEDCETLRALHKAGRLAPYLRRARKTLPVTKGEKT